MMMLLLTPNKTEFVSIRLARIFKVWNMQVYGSQNRDTAATWHPLLQHFYRSSTVSKVCMDELISK